MSLYVVVGQNAPYRRGVYVEDVDEGMIQPVHMVQEDGRWIPMYNYGLILPAAMVRPHLLRVQSKGLDKSW